MFYEMYNSSGLCMSFPFKFNNLPIDVIDHLYKEFCYVNVCDGCKWTKNNDNSEINSLSKFSIYEETSWVFQLETPCLAIGHFYNHH